MFASKFLSEDQKKVLRGPWGKSVRFARKARSRAMSILKIYDLILEIATGRPRVISKTFCTHFGDKSATELNVEFIKDPLFMDSLNHSLRSGPDSLRRNILRLNPLWRFHLATWAASQAMNLEGDFVECGVWHGWLSNAICKYTDFGNTSKAFHLFDSWGGKGSHERYQVDIFESTKARFSDYPNVYFHRGMVPEILELEASEIQKISYLSLDMNGGIAERQALEYFYDRIVEGGIIYIDDYNWNYPVLRSELREFFKNKKEQILEFPCGAALVIKL